MTGAYKQRAKGGKPPELYAPIDHAVIDSPAFASLSGEDVRVLLLIARQWGGSNNGMLQATMSFCKERGIGSHHTMAKALDRLLERGFIFRTRSHGLDPKTGKNRPALYAITWRPIKLALKPVDVWLTGFVLNAYKKWQPEKKSGWQKMPETGGTLCSFSSNNRQQKPVANNAVSATEAPSVETALSATYEILAINRGVEAQPRPQHSIASIIRKGSFAHIASVKTGYQNQVRCVTARPAQTIN